MENFKKLDYILDTHMNATEVTQAFGFKSETMLSKMRKGNSNISRLHIDGLEKYFNIPHEIFTNNIKTTEKIDKLINYYQKLQHKQKEKENFQKELLAQLELQGLIPKSLFETQIETKSLKKVLEEHKNKLIEKIALPHLKHESKVFQTNDKLFQKLKGTWYGYLYPSNPSSATEGIWEVKTIIAEDYSVVDQPWGNKGYLKLGKHESLIIKESYENDDLTILRFPNRQVHSNHFRFVIISNQNNTNYELINIGFFSKKQYPKKKAKEILGKIEDSQLKLNLDFNSRLNKMAIVPE